MIRTAKPFRLINKIITMANEIKPGDTVAFVKDKGGGKVISLTDKEHVLLELEEGFEITVNKGEIVKERDFLNEQEAEPEPELSTQAPATDTSQPGFFLAFEQSGTNTRTLYILNNTPQSLYFTIYEQKTGTDTQGLSSGALEPGQKQMINRYDIQQFEEWPMLVTQAIFFTPQPSKLPKPVHYAFKPRARAFFNAVGQAPLLAHSAHLFRLDSPENLVNPEAPEHKSEPTAPPQPEQAQSQVASPPQVVDLHIDRLVSNPKQMEREAILNYQLTYFENMLDKAIAHNFGQIIFIHGIGNGVLRERILVQLKQKSEVRSIQEADPQQYGYGATQVRFNHN